MFSLIVLSFLVTSLSKVSCLHLDAKHFGYILKSSDFIEIRQSPYFIDKTALILKTINNDETLLFTAPPGFGKSTNLDMVRVFLSNTVDNKIAQNVFADTEISKDSNFVKTHLGNHPVVYCSLEPTSTVTDYNSMLANYRISLHNAFSQHQYLASSTVLAQSDVNQFKKFIDANSYASLEPSELSSGLHFLIKALKTHHEKPVILLIDEYDSVIWESVLTQGLGISEVLGFYNDVLHKALSDKDNVKKSILTGVSTIFFKLLPGLGYTKCVRFLHDRDFESFFGLTGDEVDYLVDRSVYVNLRPNLTEWYDGYTSPDLSAHIYNTKSFLSFILLSGGELSSYWSNMKVQKSLRILLEDRVRKSLLLETPDNLMFVVRELEKVDVGVLEGVKHMITQEIWDSNVSDLYIHLLTEQGYFTFDKRWERSGYNSSVTLKLANLDVCGALKKFVVNFIQEMKKQSSNLNIV
ncbi:uncharacterized protein LOC128990306 [Macrosteles quadrilineatus]|uniref:uncharacterized protein LOC128990306 n=1 Tax=Macrosteles quadrilineatus TaxID=74068 RepID=UPI0023E0BD4D|nr:uncharacterized protein LOC128990306 [Macrosteles quadrilineatus]